MRPLSRLSSALLIGPLFVGLSGCPEQKAELKGEPATTDNADKSGAEAQKADGEKKDKKEEDEGGW